MPSWQPGNSLPLDLDIGHVLNMVRDHPGRQYCRHWRSFASVPTDTNRSIYAGSNYVREEVEWPSNRPQVVFDMAGFGKVFRDALGSWEEGSIAMVFIPSEIRIQPNDHVMPWGRMGDGTDAVRREITEVIVRGNLQTAGAGSVSVASGLATFSDNQTGLVRYGDILIAGGGKFVLGTPATATSAPVLATIAAPPRPVSAAAFSIGRDQPVHRHAAVIDRYMVAGSASLSAGFSLSFDGTSIQWFDASALGSVSAYSIRYRAVPLYVVKTSPVRVPGFDLARQSGYNLEEYPHAAVGGLVQPEAYRGAGA